MKLTAENVEEIFEDCLFVVNADGTEPVIIDGVVSLKVALHMGRVESHEENIADLLAQLPGSFQEKSGGGMSFLQACANKDGKHWTGMHNVVEHLFILGMACGKVKCLSPRELWEALPGGMPYYMVTDEWDFSHAAGCRCFVCRKRFGN